ncbi:hypothetical protein MNB_SUP05-4-694 [hydrothermal vent metagenome]|uniref:General secretion pathway GspH domain-containing protein n=1 Tax=hydrothermal vent metagenome TaxID=652676 RepID=A0A1W1DA68_9ZZZZ
MRHAITIVELLVVVAIVAIMASIVGPNLSTWNCKQNVENDFSSLNGFLDTLRLRSASQNRSFVAKVSKNGLKAHYSNKKCKVGSEVGLSNLEINSTINFKYSNLDTCFHAAGSASSTSFELYKKCDKRQYRYRSQISGVTGFINKEKYNYKTRRWDDL